MSYQELKQRQRQIRDGFHINLGLRVHRALSWLNAAEQTGDEDGRFIFLWIAFNAAYATDIDESQRLSERNTFGSFVDKLCSLDKTNRLYNFLWQEYTDNIRLLLDNKFVFQPFWDYQNGRVSQEQWTAAFASAKQSANRALGNKDTAKVIAIVLERIYTLRNQLVHGGATWSSAVNRDQVREGVRFLGKLVPIIIAIMMDNPNTLWGDPCYPVLE